MTSIYLLSYSKPESLLSAHIVGYGAIFIPFGLTNKFLCPGGPDPLSKNKSTGQ